MLEKLEGFLSLKNTFNNHSLNQEVSIHSEILEILLIGSIIALTVKSYLKDRKKASKEAYFFIISTFALSFILLLHHSFQLLNINNSFSLGLEAFISIALLLVLYKKKKSFEKAFTEQFTSESQIKKEEDLEKLKELDFFANSIPHITWTAKANGQLDYFNKLWMEYSGLSLEEPRTLAWENIIHIEDLGKCMNIWKESLKERSPFQIECRLRKGKNEGYFWHLMRATPLKNDEGEILKWFGSCTEIHEQKQLEEKLKEINEELTAFRYIAIKEMQKKSQTLNGILKYMPVLVFHFNKVGKITESVSSSLINVRFKSKNLVGKNIQKVFPGLYEVIEELISGKRNSFTVNGISKGKEWYFESFIFPDNVNNNGYIGFALDITESKLSEKRLKAASTYKSRFLANMSHEMRTPLNAIIGFTDALKDKELNKSKQKEYIEHIFNSGNLLLKLIEDILDLSKVEEGKLTIQDEPFNLREEIKSGLSPYSYKAIEKGLEFNLNLDESIPESIMGDGYRIKQVLINLIGNSIKFTQHGSILVNVSNVSDKLFSEEVKIKFSVSDTGIGIPLEKQVTIFESFTQADNSIVREFGGSGLGLTIVKQIIHLMGGEVNIISPSSLNNAIGGPGSTFWFTLTFKTNKVSNISPSISKKLKYSKVKFEKEHKILVAEDNFLNQQLAQVVLKKIGCFADFANNGKEALELLGKNEYSLVFMDLQMPIMDGLEATKIIRQANNNIPIVGLSANVFKEDIDNCFKVGMNDHMGKPYNEKQMYNVINKWCNNN